MSTQQCRSCGEPLGADARGGLCPGCLFAAVRVPVVSGPAAPTISSPEEHPGDQGAPVSGGGSAAGSEPGEGEEARLPRPFGDYELLEEIGRGGMGVVFKARQISLDRVVALKLLLGGAASSPEYIRRFRLEAAAAGGLQHPNIVAVHEVGLRDGQHFIAMDYVAGPNLGEVAGRRPLPARRAATYVRAVANAIEFAHGKGILHRDLKPSNILLDAEDQPRVTDFGLAKKLESDIDLTVTGQVLGSPNYMPPEQASGRRGNLSRLADVYSLGAVLYHLVTGRPPFHAESLVTTLEQVRASEPVPPRRLNASLPRDLETVCLKCLEKDPARRYPSAASLAAELDRFLRGETVEARPTGAVGRVWRWCRRKPALALLGLSAGLLLLTFAVGGPIIAAQQRASAERYRRLAYAGDVKAAYDWWERGLLQQATQALDRHVPLGVQTDLREFAWRFVDRLCRPYRQVPTLNADGPVVWLDVSRDGRWLAAGSVYALVRLWNLGAKPGAAPGEFRAGGPFFAGPLAFSPDSRLLVTGGFSPKRNRKGLQIWDRSSLSCLTNFPGLACRSCSFSPDGTHLALAVGDQIVILDASADWRLLGRLTNHTAAVWSVGFSADGRSVVSGSRDRTAIVWDAATWEPRAVLPHDATLFAAVFSPDGGKVATAAGDTVALWDVAGGRVLHSHVHKAPVVDLDFSPDGRWVASAGWDGVVRIWDWEGGKVRELRGHSRVVHAVRFLPSGTQLISAAWDGTIKLWDLGIPPPNDLLEGRTAREPPGQFRSPLAFSADGSVLATIGRNESDILLCDTLTGAPREPLPAPFAGMSTERSGTPSLPPGAEQPLEDLAFSPADGALVAVRGDRVETWDVHRRAVTNAFAGHAPICFSPDGRSFACQGIDVGNILFRDWGSGRTWNSEGGFEVSPDEVDFVFSPDGRWLVSTGAELVLWETATGRRTACLLSVTRDRQPPIKTAGFTPDGLWLLAAGVNADIQVWDLPRRQRVATFPGHLASIERLAVSPDGLTLATGSSIGEVLLWRLDPQQGRPGGPWDVRELLSLGLPPRTGIGDLRFTRSEDGDILAASDRAGIVRLWRAR